MNYMERKRRILAALGGFGGQATTRQIAEVLDLHVNGVAQTLGTMRVLGVEYVSGKGGDTVWRIVRETSGA